MMLHLTTRGCGDDVVLLHGWGLNGACWGDFAGRLAAEHRVLAIDLPGHGRSAWHRDCVELDGVVAAVRALVPPGATVVGWSFGGMAALRLAQLAGSAIARLVLIATTPRFARAPDWPHGVPPASLAQFGQRLQADYRRALSEFLALQVRGEADPQRVLRELKQRLESGGRPQAMALDHGLEILRHCDLRGMLHEVSQPTVVIAGSHDRLTPPEAAHFLARHLPAGRLHLLTGAGHAPFLSHCDEVLVAMRAARELGAAADGSRAAPA